MFIRHLSLGFLVISAAANNAIESRGNLHELGIGDGVILASAMDGVGQKTSAFTSIVQRWGGNAKETSKMADSCKDIVSEAYAGISRVNKATTVPLLEGGGIAISAISLNSQVGAMTTAITQKKRQLDTARFTQDMIRCLQYQRDVHARLGQEVTAKILTTFQPQTSSYGREILNQLDKAIRSLSAGAPPAPPPPPSPILSPTSSSLRPRPSTSSYTVQSTSSFPSRPSITLQSTKGLPTSTIIVIFTTRPSEGFFDDFNLRSVAMQPKPPDTAMN